MMGLGLWLIAVGVGLMQPGSRANECRSYVDRVSYCRFSPKLSQKGSVRSRASRAEAARGDTSGYQVHILELPSNGAPHLSNPDTNRCNIPGDLHTSVYAREKRRPTQPQQKPSA